MAGLQTIELVFEVSAFSVREVHQAAPEFRQIPQSTSLSRFRGVRATLQTRGDLAVFETVEGRALFEENFKWLAEKMAQGKATDKTYSRLSLLAKDGATYKRKAASHSETGGAKKVKTET